MNDGVYPRQLAPLGFDLMSQKPKRGDRSRRDDDRYLFLEALISAQQKLYISYIGRSIQDNSERFPSVLVQELIDYIGQSHYLPDDEALNCDESEARGKAQLTCLHTRMRGDRSRREDDRYLFQEAFFSAQQKLYFSYIGRSIQDNSERFPSVLVQELIDYIGQSHYLPGDEALNCDDSEGRVKSHLTCLHTRKPFDPQNYQPGERQSYAREWLPAASQAGKAHSEFVQPLPFTLPETVPLETLQRFWAHPVRAGKAHSEFVQPLPFTLPETVPLETLQRFWAHPVRAFFQMRLQVNFRTEDSEIPDTEPFILEGLSRYQINQQLLNALVEQDDAERLFRRFRAAGDLPYGAFGEIFWETQCVPGDAAACRQSHCLSPAGAEYGN